MPSLPSDWPCAPLGFSKKTPGAGRSYENSQALRFRSRYSPAERGNAVVVAPLSLGRFAIRWFDQRSFYHSPECAIEGADIWNYIFSGPLCRVLDNPVAVSFTACE